MDTSKIITNPPFLCFTLLPKHSLISSRPIRSPQILTQPNIKAGSAIRPCEVNNSLGTCCNRFHSSKTTSFTAGPVQRQPPQQKRCRAQQSALQLRVRDLPLQIRCFEQHCSEQHCSERYWIANWRNLEHRVNRTHNGKEVENRLGFGVPGRFSHR